MIGTDEETSLEAETERLFRALMFVDCEPTGPWTYEACQRIAPLTLEISRLKRERDAVILAHSYVGSDIIYGVSDFSGDSYRLSEKARDSGAKVIVFAGVVFMAETAKILAPRATVLVPDRGAGCSLADSLTGAQLRQLKAAYPDAAVVCYINSSAEVKAESDVCVTSANVYDIIARLPERRILFVPDRLMAENIRVELRRRGVTKDVISSDGTCIVHDRFDAGAIAEARARFPGVQVVAHPECPPDVAAAADFVGSTGAMMRFVKSTAAPHFLMLTECGLIGRLQVEDPEKHFIGGCRLCPFMKLNRLERIRDVLVAPRPDQIVNLDDDLRRRAARSIERMFDLAG
jgi:quinolinate synthase